MRALAAVLLSLGIAAAPVFAGNDARDTAKDETTASATASEAAPAAPTPSDPAKPESSVIENQLQDLRSLIESQTQELDEQRAELKAQQLKMTALEEKLRSAGASATETSAPGADPSVSSTSVISSEPAAAAQPAIGASPSAPPQDQDAPLQFRIGSAYITPIGFMDFTVVDRSHDTGNGIGTSFGSIPYGNSTVANHLTEFRQSMQNSRIGFRVDAPVMGAHVIGYMEADFLGLGTSGQNVAVTSNSNTLRSRLYWVDVSKSWWEVLGGQTWSLITPNRSGISPLPGNVFFSQDMDVNYQLGLVWGRIPEFRFVVHPSSQFAIAIALDQPDQYIGGSAGGGSIVLPSALSSTYTGQFDNGGAGFNTPNIAPDIILKAAADPSSKFHFEVGGVERQFRAWDSVTSATAKYFEKTGGGGFANLNAQVIPGLRLIVNTFYGCGIGRYIFGQVPDLIVHADGEISCIHAASTVTGFEWTHGNTLIYAYYGAIFAKKNVDLDANGTTQIGYGVAGNTGQNRTIQEPTIGFNQTIWRNPSWGALNVIGQYSYLVRNPWYVPTTAGNPEDAHLSMVFLDLRYTLPGAAPNIK